MTMNATKNNDVSGLAETVEKILDKGLVLNADISVSVAGTELLGIKIRAALASFETAAEYGLEFPAGTNEERLEKRAKEGRMTECPKCGQRTTRKKLLTEGCPFCGWESAQQQRKSVEIEKKDIYQRVDYSEEEDERDIKIERKDSQKKATFSEDQKEDLDANKSSKMEIKNSDWVDDE